MKKVAVVVLCVAVTMGACTTTDTPIVGSHYGDPPPRLIEDPRDPSKVKWERLQAFGPVPPALVATGQKICGRMKSNDGRYMVVGYHPAAQDVDGKPFPEGGYFCLPE